MLEIKDILSIINDDEPDRRTGDKIHVTDFIGSPAKLEMQRRWPEKMKKTFEYDPYYNPMPILTGIAIHAYMKEIVVDNWMTEAEVKNDFLIGSIDAITPDDEIIDYKCVSARTFDRKGPNPKWKLQLNIYNLLQEECLAKRLLNVIFLTGPKPSSIQYPIIIIEQPIMEFEELQDYINKKYEEIMSYRDMSDEDLLTRIHCSAEDRMESNPVYACTIPGRKKALKLFDDAGMAISYANDNELSVEMRPGKSYCMDYCSARGICAINK